MKTYTVYVNFSGCMEYEVEAENEERAKKIAANFHFEEDVEDVFNRLCYEYEVEEKD